VCLYLLRARDDPIGAHEFQDCGTLQAGCGYRHRELAQSRCHSGRSQGTPESHHQAESSSKQSPWAA